MNAIHYLNGDLPSSNLPSSKIPVSKIFNKIQSKEDKWKERKQSVRHSHLSPKEKDKVLYLLTLSSHYVEGFIDCLDELENMKVIGKENDMILVREKLLKAQKFFIEEALRGGEETFMARQEQQKRFEALLDLLPTLNIDKFHSLLNYAENLKFKKK